MMSIQVVRGKYKWDLSQTANLKPLNICLFVIVKGNSGSGSYIDFLVEG